MKGTHFLVLVAVVPAVFLGNWEQSKLGIKSDIEKIPIASSLKNIHRRSVADNANQSPGVRYSAKIGLGAIYQRGEEVALSNFKSMIHKINKDNAILPQNVTLEPVFRIIENTIYDTLVSLCHSFVNSSVQAFLFVCDEPCSRMTSLAARLGLTGIKIDRNLNNPEDFRFRSEPGSALTFLNIVPPSRLQNHALVLLLNKFNWTEICVVSDDSRYARPLVEDLYQNSESFKIVSTVKYSRLDDSFITSLSSIKTKVRVFVLFCTYANGKTVLDHATKLGLTKREFVWIVGETLVKTNEVVPDSFPVGLLGIKYHNRDITSAVNDAVETMARAVAARIDHGGLDALVPLQWNCDDSNINTTEGLRFFKEMTHVSFRGNTGFVSFDSHGQRTRARYDYMNLRSGVLGMNKRWQEVGHLEDDRVLLHQIVWPGEVLQTPSGQTKERLKIVTYQVKPLIQVIDYSADTCYSGIKCHEVSGDPQNEILTSRCCYGVCIDVLKQMSNDLEFLPDVYVMHVYAGTQEADGKWNGLIGEVMYNEADMAMASITITERRSQFIDFSVPYYHTGLKFLVANTRGSLDGYGFLKPFQVSVWVLLFSLLYFSAVSLWFFETKNPGLNRLLRSNKTHTKYDIHVSVWVMFSRLFNSNLEVHYPNFYSSRALLVGWGFACLVIGALYTANLAAFMVLTEENRSIDGINDSKIQNPASWKLKFATIPNTSIEKYFSRNFPHVHKFMVPYSIYNSSRYAVQAVKNREIDAFIWEDIFLKTYEVHDSECNIFTVGKAFAMGGFGIVLKKGSKWTKKVNEVLLKYEQLGFISEKVERWSKGSCNVFNKHQELSTDPMTIKSVLGVFYMLLAGIGYSIFVLLVEHIVYRFYLLPKKEKKQEKQEEKERSEYVQTEARVDTNFAKDPDNQILVKVEKELINLAMDLNTLRRQCLPQSVRDLSTILRRIQENKDDLVGAEQKTGFATVLTFGEMRQLIDETRCSVRNHQDEFCRPCTEKESVL